MPAVKLHVDFSSRRGSAPLTPSASSRVTCTHSLAASPHAVWHRRAWAAEEDVLWGMLPPTGPALGSPAWLQVSTPLSSSAYISSDTLMLVSPHAGLLCLSVVSNPGQRPPVQREACPFFQPQDRGLVFNRCFFFRSYCQKKS